MSINVDELGPIDWIVVEFPEPKFTGELPRSSRTSSTAT